jgi:hypothetical protein
MLTELVCECLWFLAEVLVEGLLDVFGLTHSISSRLDPGSSKQPKPIPRRAWWPPEQRPSTVHGTAQGLRPPSIGKDNRGFDLPRPD